MNLARGAAIVLAVAAAASCSLGLDEALIDRPRDAGTIVLPDGAVVPNPAGEGGIEGGPGATPDVIPCTGDEQCVTDHPCLKGKCDLARKACAFDVCRPAACSASTCNAQTRSCAPPAGYKYRAAQFSLGTTVLCPRCAVAVHPYLYVLTPIGLAVFNVSNPSSNAPLPVPVIGVGFVPTQITQSGSRVWLTGAPSGPGPSRVPIAYIDSPADPFVTRIAARSVLATYNRPATEGFTLFPRGLDSALVIGPAAQQFPSAFLEGTPADPYSLAAVGFPPPPNTAALATTGRRVLLGATTGTAASFQLVDNVGATNPTIGPAIAIAPTGNVSGVRGVAQSTDGAVFWATGIHEGVMPEGARTSRVRGHFLVANETAPIDGASPPVDVEVYDVPGLPQGANAGVIGPIALIDARTALIATTARENAAQTVVQIVKREPLGVVKDGTTPRRNNIPVAIGAFAAATASNGIGYLVANDQPAQAGLPALGTVYVYDPACSP